MSLKFSRTHKSYIDNIELQILQTFDTKFYLRQKLNGTPAQPSCVKLLFVMAASRWKRTKALQNLSEASTYVLCFVPKVDGIRVKRPSPSTQVKIHPGSATGKDGCRIHNFHVAIGL